MNHRDKDQNGRKDVPEDEAVRHVEAVEGAGCAEDADVAFERLADADVVVLRTTIESVRSVNVDDLGGFQRLYECTCVTDLEQHIKMIIFESILTTFEISIVF